MSKKVRAYAVSYLRALYFSLAMSAMFFLVAHYFQYSPRSIPLLALAGLVSILSITAFLKAVTGDRFLSVSSVNVLSVGTQKKFRVLGILLPLPALVFCLAFVTCMITFDYSASAYRYVDTFSRVELALFGKSVLPNFIFFPHACPDCQGFEEAPQAVESSKDIDFGPYMVALQRRIKTNWHHPESSAPTRVIVEFRISTDGDVCDLKLVNSSGKAPVDRAALLAVQDAAPFPALPNGSPSDVDIRFNFDYNVKDPLDSLKDSTL